MPDIIGIGAVNVDYIIDSEKAASALADKDSTRLAGFEPGSERAATGSEVDEALQRLRSLKPVASPGGSSLNTLATISATGAEVSTGFIGVRGRSGTEAFSLPDWFNALGIEDHQVIDNDELAGICISYTDGGQRSMLTTPGANRSIMEYLAKNSQAITDYLKRAKLILVTSFADLNDVTPLLGILTEVRTACPAIKICCDPGALWTRKPVPVGVDAVMGLADWILVNQLEFDTYTGGTGEDGDQSAVVTFLPFRAKASFLLKRPDRIETFARLQNQVLQRTFPNSLVLRSDEVVDDTGAGDAFAAGFLISLTEQALTQEDGIELGFRLAREKLRWSGLGGLDRYQEIYRVFIDDLQAGSEPKKLPRTGRG